MVKKILIVEDDPVAARVFSTQFQRAGFEVRVVPDGESGYAQIQAFQPDALLTDYMVPKLNGIDLIKRIKASPDQSIAPLVVYTNACVPNVVTDALAAGATHVFDKATLSPQQLIEVFRLPAAKAAGKTGGS